MNILPRIEWRRITERFVQPQRTVRAVNTGTFRSTFQEAQIARAAPPAARELTPAQNRAQAGLPVPANPSPSSALPSATNRLENSSTTVTNPNAGLRDWLGQLIPPPDARPDTGPGSSFDPARRVIPAIVLQRQVQAQAEANQPNEPNFQTPFQQDPQAVINQALATIQAVLSVGRGSFTGDINSFISNAYGKHVLADQRVHAALQDAVAVLNQVPERVPSAALRKG